MKKKEIGKNKSADAPYAKNSACCCCGGESGEQKKCHCADFAVNSDQRNKVCDCNIIHHDLVDEAKGKMLSAKVLQHISRFFKALADDTRAKIMYLLCQQELCVCDISFLLDMTKSAISHQLGYLRKMKLIKSRKSGKEVFYSLADEHVRQLFEVSLQHIMEDENETNCQN